MCLSVCVSVPKTKRDGLRRLGPTVGPLPFTRDDRRATGRWLRETGERRRRVRSAVPMAVGCVHGRAMPLCGVGATGRVHAMNFGTWMIMNDTADASTHLCDEAEAWRPTTITREGQQPWSRPAPGFEPRGLPTRAAVSTAVIKSYILFFCALR